MATEPLKEITAGKLNLEFFNKIIKRIEDIKPIDGENISAVAGARGIKISLNAEAKEFNVCSNGTPIKMKLFVQKKG
jgi:hypothetical protein